MSQALSLPYYLGYEAEQYAFYRIPKLLIIDERFCSISVKAKLLYGMMLDRMSLSIKNGWIDEQNRIYISTSLFLMSWKCCIAKSRKPSSCWMSWTAPKELA